MRKRNQRLTAAAALFAASVVGGVFSPTHAYGATLQWDADGATPGILDGAGNWHTAGNWWNAGTASNGNWVNTTTDAVFGGGGATGTPGLVKISSTAVTPASLTFNVDGYTIEDTSSSIRLILSQTGGITAHGDTTIRTFRGVVMLTGSQTFTVASGKTLTMDNSPENREILVGGNQAGRTLTIGGGGTVEFISTNTTFSLGVPQATTLTVNNATVTATGRTAGAFTDGAALVIRSRSNFSDAAGRVFVNTGGLIDLATFTLVVQQNQDLTFAATGPPGELHLDGGTVAAGAIGSAAIASTGVIYLNGGGIRATMDNDNFIPAPWVNGVGGQGPQALYVAANGATINTDGFDVTSHNPLIENPASTGGAFTKIGAGTYTSNADNTYTGGTTISAGTLELGNGGTSGSILGDVLNNGTLAFNRSDDVTFAGLITGTGGISQRGRGATFVTNASNSYAGESVADGGLLAFNTAAAYGNTSGIVANAYGAVGLETSSLAGSFIDEIHAGSSPSLGGLALASVDAASDVDFTTAPLSHANTAGMSVGAIGAVSHTGTITPNPALGYRVGGGGELTLPNTNALTGSHNVTVTNGGVVVLTASNNYSGSTTVDSFTTLAINSISNIGDGSVTTVTLNGGTLRTDANIPAATRDLALTASGGAVDTAVNNSTFGNVAGSGSFAKQGAGNLTVNHLRAGDTTIADGKVTIAPQGGVAGASKVGALEIGDTAMLDLTNNKLITSSAAGTWNGVDSVYEGVTGLVAAGRNGGTWDGNGIVTSETDAIAPNNITTIAVARAGDVAKTSLGGQSADPDDTLVMYTYNGDANLSGNVDADDYFIIDKNYASSGSVFGFNNGDFDYNGVIDGDDYAAIDAGFSGPGAPISAGSAVGGVQAVPEPAGVGTLLVGLLALARRRRRE